MKEAFYPPTIKLFPVPALESSGGGASLHIQLSSNQMVSKKQICISPASPSSQNMPIFKQMPNTKIEMYSMQNTYSCFETTAFPTRGLISWNLTRK